MKLTYENNKVEKGFRLKQFARTPDLAGVPLTERKVQSLFGLFP